MFDQIVGDGFDALFGFEDVSRGPVLLFNGQNFFVRAFGKQVFELRVEFVFFVQSGVGGFAFVQDLHRGFVIHGVLQAVFVDVAAKALPRLLFVAFGD